jgi:hypothetical protein
LELILKAILFLGEHIKLAELLALLGVEELKDVSKILKLKYNKLPKDALVESIKKYAKSQRSIFNTGNMEAQVIKM